MTWYEWVWASVAVVLFLGFFAMVLVGSAINSQSGDLGGALLMLLIGPPAAAIASVTWPLWFPFTFVLDIREDIKNKKNK